MDLNKRMTLLLLVVLLLAILTVATIVWFKYGREHHGQQNYGNSSEPHSQPAPPEGEENAGVHVAWKYQTGGHVESTPTVTEGRVYAGSWDGFLYCLDAESGKLVWKYQVDDLVYSPAVVNGRVYVGSADGYIYCFE
jgi:outer membrane protein assembly factor BamB